MAAEIVGQHTDGMRFRQLISIISRNAIHNYLDGLTEAEGQADRRGPIENYNKGVMLSIERKSVVPMAAQVQPR